MCLKRKVVNDKVYKIPFSYRLKRKVRRFTWGVILFILGFFVSFSFAVLIPTLYYYYGAVVCIVVGIFIILLLILVILHFRYIKER